MTPPSIMADAQFRRDEFDTMAKTSLKQYIESNLITDVLFELKSGKEATVYCCSAHPSTGFKYIAAKVYRPRQFSSFTNDSIYQEGKVILDTRMAKAFAHRTKVGRHYGFVEWIEKEWIVLKKLYRRGADVPKPIAFNEDLILMEYVGTPNEPAVLLKKVYLDSTEAVEFFNQVVKNIRLMLKYGIVHADLSEFNILYDNGIIKIIDFPQAVDPQINPHAYDLLLRDVLNICKFFSKFGVVQDYESLTNQIWTDYQLNEL